MSALPPGPALFCLLCLFSVAFPAPSVSAGSHTTETVLEFAGGQDRVRISPHPPVPDGKEQVALAFWMKPARLRGDFQYAFHLHSRQGGSNIGDSVMWAGICENNRITATIGAVSTSWHAGRTDVRPRPNQWYHVAALWDGSRVRVYVDGVENVSYELSSLRSADNSLWLGFNPNQGNRRFRGSLAEVGIWVGTLPDVSAIMNQGIDKEQPELAAYWPLDDGEGDKVRDHSGHGHHGTLTGATWQTEEVAFARKPPRPPVTTPEPTVQETYADNYFDPTLVFLAGAIVAVAAAAFLIARDPNKIS